MSKVTRSKSEQKMMQKLTPRNEQLNKSNISSVVSLIQKQKVSKQNSNHNNTNNPNLNLHPVSKMSKFLKKICVVKGVNSLSGGVVNSVNSINAVKASGQTPRSAQQQHLTPLFTRKESHQYYTPNDLTLDVSFSRPSLSRILEQTPTQQITQQQQTTHQISQYIAQQIPKHIQARVYKPFTDEVYPLDEYDRQLFRFFLCGVFVCDDLQPPLQYQENFISFGVQDLFRILKTQIPQIDEHFAEHAHHFASIINCPEKCTEKCQCEKNKSVFGFNQSRQKIILAPNGRKRSEATLYDKGEYKKSDLGDFSTGEKLFLQGLFSVLTGQSKYPRLTNPNTRTYQLRKGGDCKILTVGKYFVFVTHTTPTDGKNYNFFKYLVQDNYDKIYNLQERENAYRIKDFEMAEKNIFMIDINYNRIKYIFYKQKMTEK